MFISGPHGAGKSSLVKKLLERIPASVSPVLETKTPQFYWGTPREEINYFHRQALKEAHRAMENYEYLRAAKTNPKKIVIGDRCVYDGVAYRNANVKLGWISQSEADKIRVISPILYPPELLSPQVVFLNPDFETLKEHLKTRWKEEKSWKFKETEMDYLRAVHECFEELKESPNSLYLGEEFSDLDLQRIIDWVQPAS